MQTSPEMATLVNLATCDLRGQPMHLENWDSRAKLLTDLNNLSQNLYNTRQNITNASDATSKQLQQSLLESYKNQFTLYAKYILTFQDTFAILRGIQRDLNASNRENRYNTYLLDYWKSEQ